MKVYLRHVRQLTDTAGKPLCMRGIRAAFTYYHLDFSLLIKDGIDEEVLAKTGDERALQSIAFAHAEQESLNGKG